MRIAVLGVMGAGKSTFAEALANRLGYKFHPEPYEESLFLRRCYDDPSRWAFHTQVEMVTLGIEQHRKQGVLDGSHVLAYWLYSQLYLTEEERSVVSRMYRSMLKTVDNPDLTIYLKVDAKVLYDRVRTRGRSMENGLTLNTLQTMCGLFNNIIERDPYRNLVFDYNDFQEMPALIERTTDQISPTDRYTGKL